MWLKYVLPTLSTSTLACSGQGGGEVLLEDDTLLRTDGYPNTLAAFASVVVFVGS